MERCSSGASFAGSALEDDDAIDSDSGSEAESEKEPERNREIASV